MTRSTVLGSNSKTLPAFRCGMRPASASVRSHVDGTRRSRAICVRHCGELLSSFMPHRKSPFPCRCGSPMGHLRVISEALVGPSYPPA